MKLAEPALLCLVLLTLTGCTSPATTLPIRSTASRSVGTPSPTATPTIVDGLPSSCDAFFSGLKKFVSPDGSLVLDPTWKSGPGVPRAETSGYGTYDPTLANSLSKAPGLICDWAPPTGPSDTFLTTQVRHVDAVTAQAAIVRMKQLGWFCSEFYGGEWCLTNDSHTGRAIGESQFLGHGDWLASNWNNAGPETYTPELLRILFG
ncbi:hypothetical protein [Leifsonia tongyongensis]|uniref:hypothetical protein n=1 Tax=Leifsonia tongyongensis TaxID=1268043 RepID=UPI0019643728|nr:hypothetical protein [Diaminobutyricibacter tongyongensis]